MLPVIQIGPLALQTPGLIILLGFWLALEMAGRQGARHGLNRNVISSAGFYGALTGIVGARLGYVIQHWPVYRENLLGVLALNPQTLQPAAGLLAGVVVAGLYLRRRGVPLRPLLDAATPGLAVFVSALALANFASGEAFGAETSVPWAIYLWNAPRHPVQLYELAGGLVILLLLWQAGRDVPTPGLLFLLFVALYGGARLLLEPFRASSAAIFGGLRAAQVTGLGATLAALWLMRVWSVEHSPTPQRGATGAENGLTGNR